MDGWRVPLLQAHVRDENVTLLLDDRYGVTLTMNEAERVVPFLAHCIAVALGYPCHPNEDTERLDWQPQPHPVRMHGISAVRSVPDEAGCSPESNPDA
jgi:hypothetical protein